MTVPVQPRPPAPTPEDIKAQYGFVALIAQQIPEIGSLMQQAVQGNWTADRFSLALAGTQWWKSTPEAARQWTVRAITDPASAEADIQNGSKQILQDLIDIGVHPYDDAGNPRLDLRSLYVQVRTKGLEGNEAGRRAFLFEQGHQAGKAGTQGGRYGQLVTEMVKMAQEYGYASPGAMTEIIGAANAAALSGGAGNVEYWRRKMIGYAKAKYGAFADRIDAGESVMDLARPYMDSYATVLEVAPGDVGLQDQAVQKALQGDGKQAQAVWQFEQELRKDPRWGNTKNARQSAASTLTAIGRSFGMIG